MFETFNDFGTEGKHENPTPGKLFVKFIVYVSFLAVFVSLGYLLFWMPKSEVVNSQLECVRRQQLAVSGDTMTKDDANRFCKLADTRLNAVQKNIGKL